MIREEGEMFDPSMPSQAIHSKVAMKEFGLVWDGKTGGNHVDFE